jgi:hypothetical protein
VRIRKVPKRNPLCFSDLGYSEHIMATWTTWSKTNLNPYYGRLAELNLWSYALNIEDMVAFTSKCASPDDFGKKPDLFDWKSIKFENYVKEPRAYFKQDADERVCGATNLDLLYLHMLKLNFQSFLQVCHSHGGKVASPSTISDQVKLFEWFQKETSTFHPICGAKIWYGVKKSKIQGEH